MTGVTAEDAYASKKTEGNNTLRDIKKEIKRNTQKKENKEQDKNSFILIHTRTQREITCN